MRVLPGIITVVIFASIASSQGLWERASADYKAERKLAAVKLSEPALPSMTALKGLSLNQRGAVADLLWLKTIQYFGQGNPYGKYPSLGAILNTITELDPKFAYPYEFGLIVLPFMDQSEQAEQLGKRAEEALPENGLITFYFASLYHLNLKDFVKAAEYYEKAANLPGGPPASRELSGVALSSANSSLATREAALYFWKTVYENAKDEDEKERAARWFGHMQLVYEIERNADQFKNDHGRFPFNVEELVTRGYLAETPVSPINRLLVLDHESGRVDFSELRSNN
jgi:tetratricopeptide (TPR) repeat protein